MRIQRNQLKSIFSRRNNVLPPSRRRVSQITRNTRIPLPQPDLTSFYSQSSLLVGLCTVNTRKTKSYLLSTLNDLIKNKSNRTKLKIIVYECDWKGVENNHVERAKEEFKAEIASGLLTFCRIDNHEEYGLQYVENYSASWGRWAFKQNCDYSEAFKRSIGRADYYMHIEDDVKACRNYDLYTLYEIDKNKNWSSIRMSGGGFIGWVFRNEDLQLMSDILNKEKFSGRPCDFIVSDFVNVKKPKKLITPKYSAFQHVGQERSLTGDVNHTVFKNFVR